MAVKQDIERAERELEANSKRIARCKRLLDKKAASRKELYGGLAEARKALQHAYAVRDELKRKGGLDGEKWQDDRIRERLDAVADRIEETVVIRDRIIDRLDTIAEQRGNVLERLRNWFAFRKDGRAQLKRLRAKRKRIKERRSEDRLSEHFSLPEMACNDGTPAPNASIPALEAWCRDIGEPLRARYGTVTINSAYRTPSWNARVGGEPNSIHIYSYHPNAVAVDFTCATGTPADWFNFTAGKADGRGRYATFHHADNRNRIGWPDAVWYG